MMMTSLRVHSVLAAAEWVLKTKICQFLHTWVGKSIIRFAFIQSAIETNTRHPPLLWFHFGKRDVTKMVNGERVACSRLRDSRVRWNANMKKKKTRGTWGEEGRPANFSRAFHFCVFPTFWEQWTGWGTGSQQTNGKMKKKGSKPNLKPSPISHFILNSLLCSHFSFSCSPS